MTDEIFLHHYDASPFTQKAIKMLAIKGALWNSVIHPMIAPKPKLTALTGGYRGTPVMQIGADLFVDTQLIAEELERRFPKPTLYPGGKGVAHMLCDWGDAYFRAGLDIAIKEFAGVWEEDFYRDRNALFSDLDFEEARARFPGACARLRNQARMLDEQLSDGRAFLMGEAPGLADIQSYTVNWFTRGGFSFVEELFADFKFLNAWEASMAGLGEGKRTESTAHEAHRAAQKATTIAKSGVDPRDPLGLAVGDRITVAPETSRRGAATGRLIHLTPREVAIEPEDTEIKGVTVHYPRLGYAVART